MIVFRRSLAALLASAALATPALAQAPYPNRPISMVVPFAAGGPTDTVARLTAETMGRELGQTVVIENVGGAGGTLGAARVAQAKPDGYTILMHHIGMGTTPTLYRRLSYDPVEGFETVGLVTEVPMTILGRKISGPSSLSELVALMRSRKDSLNLANAGVGAASHLCGLLLQSAVQQQVTTIPYRGTAPAMTDLIGGTVDILCDQTTSTTEQIKAGAVRAYAVTTRERLATLPTSLLPSRRGYRRWKCPSGMGSTLHGARPEKSTSASLARYKRPCARSAWWHASLNWARHQPPKRWRRLPIIATTGLRI